MHKTRRLALACLLALAASACTTSTPPAPPAASTPPKLLVFLVVDGLPMRQVLAYRDQLQPDGFRRFLDHGAWFANMHYGHGFTVTAAGHSIMLSGAYPNVSGIIGNEWRDPQTLAEVYNTQDEKFFYLGEGNKTTPLSGTSPRMLLAETVGDVLRQDDPRSKVIGISGKDRGAILPAGHLGTAYMYMSETGQFATSSYYVAHQPPWVDAFNAAKPADAYFHRSWTPLLPESAYARSVPDGQPWQSSGGLGNRLPTELGAGQDAPGPKFYGQILPSPFGDLLTLDFARAAITGEQLGTDDKPDILAVSLSSHDYINHAFGPESRLSQDHFLHLDLALQAFFKDLDAKVGRDNYVLMLTADHGFADTPEWAKTQGRDAGRLASAAMTAKLNEGLVKQFGPGRWAVAMSATGILFDLQLIASKGLQPDQVYEAAKPLLLQIDGVGAVFTRAQLAGEDTSTPYLAQMRKSWHPGRAAPVQVVLKRNWLWGSRPAGSSHGSPYDYDTHVPLLAWGPAWVGQGEVKQRTDMADVAPTVARILHLRKPAQAQGSPLPLPLK